AGLIVNNLQAPDIVALEEVQDNKGGCVSDTNLTPAGCNDDTVAADVTINQLLTAIHNAGGPDYSYRQTDPINNQDVGQPFSNIRVVFRFRTDPGVAFVDRAPDAGACPNNDLSTCAVGVTGSGSGTHLTFSPGRIDPTNSAFNVNAGLNTFASRKPLAGEFTF